MGKELLISARVSAEVKGRLEDAARDERRTLSNYVALVLEQHVAAMQAPPPSGLAMLKNVAFARKGVSEKDSNVVLSDPGDELIAEALERLEDGTFTKEEAHRFVDQGVSRLIGELNRSAGFLAPQQAQDLYGPPQNPAKSASAYGIGKPSVRKRKQRHHHDE
jgi:predicted DNA-binding protein